jgi:hypothetical protein
VLRPVRSLAKAFTEAPRLAMVGPARLLFLRAIVVVVSGPRSPLPGGTVTGGCGGVGVVSSLSCVHSDPVPSQKRPLPALVATSLPGNT